MGRFVKAFLLATVAGCSAPTAPEGGSAPGWIWALPFGGEDHLRVYGRFPDQPDGARVEFRAGGGAAESLAVSKGAVTGDLRGFVVDDHPPGRYPLTAVGGAEGAPAESWSSQFTVWGPETGAWEGDVYRGASGLSFRKPAEWAATLGEARDPQRASLESPDATMYLNLQLLEAPRGACERLAEAYDKILEKEWQGFTPAGPTTSRTVGAHVVHERLGRWRPVHQPDPAMVRYAVIVPPGGGWLAAVTVLARSESAWPDAQQAYVEFLESLVLPPLP